MIVLAGQNPVANVLHIVTGPETDFWMHVHGAAVMDLTPVLGQMDQTRPIYLHLTRCSEEHSAAARLNALVSAGSTYPFAPPVFIFTPNSAKPPAEGVEGADGVQGAPGAVYPEFRQSPKDFPTGRCSRCCGDHELVPKITPAICYSCARIDLGVAHGRRGQQGARPPRPPQEEGDAKPGRPA